MVIPSSPSECIREVLIVRGRCCCVTYEDGCLRRAVLYDPYPLKGGCTLFDHEAMFFATTLRSIPYVLSSSAPCLRSPRLQVFSTRNKGHKAPKIRRRPCDIFSCCVLASVYTRLVGGVWIRARRRCEVEPWFVSISTIMYSLFFIYSLLF